MTLTSYFPEGMKRGDQLLYTLGDSVAEQTLEVIAAEDWHVALKSKSFAFSVGTSKDVASDEAPSKVRVNEVNLVSTSAQGDTQSKPGTLIVNGGFDQPHSDAIAIIETGYEVGNENGDCQLKLGAGFGDYADQVLHIQMKG